MKRCSHPGCSWRSIAPSEDAALAQFAEHLVESHSKTVDVDIPEGMVQIKLHEEGEWVTTTFEEARKLHDRSHDD
ncbi:MULTISPECIES: DUF1059 domain-containing protein [Haloferax]|uniref:DUF1059 domain-containing protein n=1 Tax=Haloferax marinum TaxID=2666143 RepID=A0A6A8G2G1_9EURY|nr:MULTISPECIES: DUF1059 domain-containing protein [Haloferax]KAB1196352.1 DUF1059 domain-containing protein [Haloferax sp. CBA1150]MRW95344.1 DUF1059 domain-containing protein [Haloferax marinum]